MVIPLFKYKHLPANCTPAAFAGATPFKFATLFFCEKFHRAGGAGWKVYRISIFVPFVFHYFL